MKYGYFDDKKREYVITRPDTPAPWVNYLGDPEYGAIVSNNAGGQRESLHPVELRSMQLHRDLLRQR